MSKKHQKALAEKQARPGAVMDFPAIKEEEQARRVMAEATRLANLAPGEWTIWVARSAERLGIPPAGLEHLVKAQLKVKERREREARAEERRIEQRAEKKRKEDERKKELEQRRIDKEVERKAKDKQKTFKDISKFPSDLQEKELERLANRLGEDLDTLRDEFSEFAGGEGPTVGDFLSSYQVEGWQVEPWDEQVPTAALLQELINKINKHVVARPHEVLAIALWIMLAWAHETAAHHSPYLVATSAEADCGKTTLIIGVVGRLVPRPFPVAEPTAATVFRVADAHRPCLLCDDVDTLFARKLDLASLFKIGWTRGPKVPRSERVHGTWVTRWYDPFCPKACSLIGTNMPLPLLGRCILIKLQPKLPSEKVEKPTDDDVFRDLCRKAKRWADDNAAALKNAKPPADFNNRAADNWTLQLAIAALAGGEWPHQAREAADRLSRTMRKPSWRQRLLAEFQVIFASRKYISSEEFVAAITADPLSIWREYNRGGPITQRQVADLLKDLDIFPDNVGPKRVKGYRDKDFKAKRVFERYLPRDPLIRSGG
jgi:hypothetical protein